MRDIVIPYKANRSGELNTCIDLIEKNVPHRNIYVVEQYNRQPFSEVSHVNQILKLKWAIENYDLTDQVYLFNDDFFVLEPVDDIPYYHKGSLQAHYETTHWRPYKQAMKNTLDYLGDGALSYELHLPMKMNKEVLSSLINDIGIEIRADKWPLIRSLYGNKYFVDGEYTEDVKNLKSNFEGKTFLSTDERTFRGELGEYIRSKT